MPAPDETRYPLYLESDNRLQLEAAGVPSNRIWVSPDCTACDTGGFFSHRAEHGKTGRMMGLVGIMPGKARSIRLNRRGK